MEVLNKYPSLCAHDFQKSLTNEVELPCNQQPGLRHRVSQFGKICNKCTQVIKDSYGQGSCIVCEDNIEQYLRERELCQHEGRELDELHLKCLNDPAAAHDLPLPAPICRKCSDKVRAAFMNAKGCRVCEGREQELLRDLEKVFVSPSYSHVKNVLALLQAAAAPEEDYKNEIESACKAQPRAARRAGGAVPAKLVEEFEREDREEAHISKRYKLYPKCRKHRGNPISVCNSCLVALLNLDCCPYGCPEDKAELKARKENNVRHSETGFLNLFPMLSKESYYLELFVVRLVEEKARLDRWELSVRKVVPKREKEEDYLQRFALYSAVVAVSKKDFFICGGVGGQGAGRMRPTSHCFVVTVSPDNKEFEIIPIPPMLRPRSGHSLAYNQNRKMVFAIGGYEREQGFLGDTEVYSIEQRQWFQLGSLAVERSKPTVAVFQDKVYVFGGLTSNQRIHEVAAERLNYESQKWEGLSYGGYDAPFTTNSTASSALLPFQEKEELLLFGGSNAESKTSIIQRVVVKEQSFLIDYRNYLALEYPREGCTLALINEDTLLCFGGVQEHEPFLAIDVVKLRPSDRQLHTLYVNDRIQLGSYRSVSREDSERLYLRLKEQLKRYGLISEDERELAKEEGLVTPYNCQLIEKLWFTVGKNYVWLPL